MPTTPLPKILIVDDDADTRANLRDILELDHFQMEMAGSMAEALARHEWSGIEVVILDRRLPDGSAHDLLPEIKRLAPQASIIIVTGFADVESAVSALKQGAEDYILKPINPDELRTRLGNILERKRTRQALEEAAQRALQAERLAAIGETMTGLAHESRNALQRSKACLEMLVLEVEDRPEALDLVTRTMRAQEHLQLLYEEVRQYAAPIVLERERVDLCELWREIWADVTHTHSNKQISIREEVDGACVECEADRFAIGRVFRNILENACDASPDKAEIRIRCREIPFNGRPALEIAFRDQGPGIPQEQLSRIFEPFFTTKTKGTGLGMAIAQRIVADHGGHIAVGDAADSGAEIVVILPKGTI